MGTQTKYLQLYKPAKNDYYNVETDQNENFDKIDKKIEEMDKAAKEVKELANTKEPAFIKKSGFNLEKTSDYKASDDNKVFTQQGAYNLNTKLQQNIDGKIGYVKDLGDINSPEELLALAPGVYKLLDKNLFGLGRGYWTVTKYISGNVDQIVRVNFSIGGDYFIQGGFNHGKWTAWHRFNACPYNIGDIYITTNSGNPSTTWLGTTWEKIEGRFLLGTSGSGASKQTGGSSSVTLGINNMPSHNHSASQSSHSHTQPAHTHTLNTGMNDSGKYHANGSETGHIGPEWTLTVRDLDGWINSAGGENTGSAQPSISVGNTGGGQAFSIMPPYFTVHVWVRTK